MRERASGWTRAACVSACVAACVAMMGCQPADETFPDAGGDAGSDAAATVTYTRDVKPILLAKCSPCHAGESQGHHDIATTYADVMKPVQSLDATDCWKDEEQTMPKTIGECALISITRGWMPQAKGCGAPTPPEPDACVSSADKAIIAAWVAAGMPKGN